MSSVAILIPSYKRPEVLKLTLEKLFTNTTVGSYPIGIFVALNKVTEESEKVVKPFISVADSLSIKYDWVSYKHNIGKANALNNLFNKFCGGYEYIVTMDNDMVIDMPWGHLLDAAKEVNFDLMGFGSSTFWAHLPSRELCEGDYRIIAEDYRLYRLDQIAGGMMLFPRQILEKHRWSNGSSSGVYGFDDAQMCLDVEKKYVLFWDRPWLSHDILSRSTEKLSEYQDKKEELFRRGIYVFDAGWDE